MTISLKCVNNDPPTNKRVKNEFLWFVVEKPVQFFQLWILIVFAIANEFVSFILKINKEFNGQTCRADTHTHTHTLTRRHTQRNTHTHSHNHKQTKMSESHTEGNAVDANDGAADATTTIIAAAATAEAAETASIASSTVTQTVDNLSANEEPTKCEGKSHSFTYWNRPTNPFALFSPPRASEPNDCLKFELLRGIWSWCVLSARTCQCVVAVRRAIVTMGMTQARFECVRAWWHVSVRMVRELNTRIVLNAWAYGACTMPKNTDSSLFRLPSHFVRHSVFFMRFEFFSRSLLKITENWIVIQIAPILFWCYEVFDLNASHSEVHSLKCQTMLVGGHFGSYYA